MEKNNFSEVPYISEQTKTILNNEISTKGFVPDKFLTSNQDIRCYGLNVAIGWPLPIELKEKYENMRKDLVNVAPDTYVYPYEQTHITLLTLIKFQNHENPSTEKLTELKKLKSTIVDKVADLFNKEQSIDLKPFIIDIGYPYLSSNAIFLPIKNPTEEIKRIRETIIPIMQEEVGINPLKPPSIHSTIARFLKKPDNPKKFKEEFDRKFSKMILGKAKIKKILITAETKPYMKKGENLYKFSLDFEK